MLNIKNDKPLRAGQVFTVSLGVSGLENADATDARGKTYALQVMQLRGFVRDGACRLTVLQTRQIRRDVAHSAACVSAVHEHRTDQILVHLRRRGSAW